MEVFIEKLVHQQIVEFYEVAMSKHITLDENVVSHKIKRLYDAIELLGRYAEAYSVARLKREWITNGYREYVFEDFHFAYQIYTREDGSRIVRVHDACHSLLYRE